MIHELKIYPQHFANVMLGLKKFEVRKNDRDYQIGDLLILNEFDPKTERYTGGQIKRKIDFILDISWLTENYVVLQIIKEL